MEAVLSDKIFWLSRLLSALRTGIACLLVFQGLSQISQYVAFPVFGYVVTVLVMSESALGKALEDGAYALFGTLQAVAFAIVVNLCVCDFAGAENMSLGVCLACIFTSSFIFTIFPNQRSVKKRLALAITTIIYVTVYVNPAGTHTVFFPLKLTVTTILGTMSAIIALIFPVPRLSTYQARYKTKLCAELAMDEFRILIDAFCSSSPKQAEAAWEPGFLSSATCISNESLRGINSCLSAMSLALEEGPVANDTPDHIQSMIRSSLEQFRVWSSLLLTGDLTRFSKTELLDKQLSAALLSLNTTAALWYESSCKLQENRRFRQMFFLFTARKFVKEIQSLTEAKSEPASKRDESADSRPSCTSCLKNADSLVNSSPSNILAATKNSINLGLLYSKEYGYWSTITIALGLFNNQSGTFSSTSQRLQGTALGTIYGYLVALVTRQSAIPTVLALVPWLLFTSFMRKSKMLKLVGGSSALTSALIILGKKRPGDVENFAVLRVTQALVGLSTYMIVEAVIVPRRAARLVAGEFRLNLARIQDCFQSLYDLTETPCSRCFNRQISHLRSKSGA